MKLLGITGGIGSGKSYVARLLSQYWGIPVYDCDAAAKRLEEDDAQLRHALMQLAGPHVYDADGRLQRRELAAYIFGDATHASAVNALVHPAVRRDLDQWLARQTAPLAAVESAILYESGFAEGLDATLCVEASTPTRLRRAMQRDAATQAQVEARMAHQKAELRQQADYIVTNEGDGDDALLQQLRHVVSELLPEEKIFSHVTKF